uniref:Uncharacterized protein n=1 Tax=Panagrolaimus sp. PS1159 TaxID=55785 RepID=A0AC35GLW6_9BILA
MAFFGDIRFLAFVYFALILDVLAAKPLGVPFFALRRHQSSMRHGFGPIPQSGTDVFGTQFMTSGMRAAARSKPAVPNYYAGGLINDDETAAAVVEEDFPKEAADYAAGRPQYPANIPSANLDSYLSNLPSRSLIDKIEHPIAAHRVKMNPACLMDPPIKSRFARNISFEKPIIFYSFNPAGQSCDKLIADENNLEIGGTNIYQSLRECQIDCCPTALCRRM